MTYRRTIPRDLFNEANLLKCYAQIYLNLEPLGLQSCLVHDVDNADHFDVWQDPTDGSITVRNLHLMLGRRYVELRRPQNSREAWPLYARFADADDDADEADVFTDTGAFTPEFLAMITEAVNG